MIKNTDNLNQYKNERFLNFYKKYEKEITPYIEKYENDKSKFEVDVMEYLKDTFKLVEDIFEIKENFGDIKPSAIN